jgi:hypothetical protein
MVCIDTSKWYIRHLTIVAFGGVDHLSDVIQNLSDENTRVTLGNLNLDGYFVITGATAEADNALPLDAYIPILAPVTGAAIVVTDDATMLDAKAAVGLTFESAVQYGLGASDRFAMEHIGYGELKTAATIHRAVNENYYMSSSRLRVNYTPSKQIMEFFSTHEVGEDVPLYTWIVLGVWWPDGSAPDIAWGFSGQMTLEYTEQRSTKLAGWV